MIYKYLPYFLFKPLFGDRKKWGTKLDNKDEDYKLWSNESYLKFYQDNQKGFIGSIVCNYGFQIVNELNYNDKIILEIGPGHIEHIKYNQTRPLKYYLADVRSDFLDSSAGILYKNDFKDVVKIHYDGISFPIPDNSFDIILTFHQLEHVYEIETFISELKRILKPGGIIAGAIPAEGGIAWGFGRFLTSRRYVKKQMNFDYDKIICWEHPNFVDTIKRQLDDKFICVRSVKKPFAMLPFDLNLSWSFIYRKKQD